MQIVHYVSPDRSKEHQGMAPTCGSRNIQEPATIVPEFVTCEDCRATEQFKKDEND